MFSIKNICFTSPQIQKWIGSALTHGRLTNEKKPEAMLARMSMTMTMAIDILTLFLAEEFWRNMKHDD